MKICYLKIDVSCEASVNFHHISQNATPATEFAPCHHLTQAWQCDWQETRNTTRLKCCACHAKKRWARPKCCACDENCHTSSGKCRKSIFACHTKRLSTRSRTRLNVTKCHACHAKRSKTCANFKRDAFCRTRDGHIMGLARTVADGCGRLGKVDRTHPQSPDPQSETGTLATHSGKTLYHQFSYMCGFTNLTSHGRCTGSRIWERDSAIEIWVARVLGRSAVDRSLAWMLPLSSVHCILSECQEKWVSNLANLIPRNEAKWMCTRHKTNNFASC